LSWELLYYKALAFFLLPPPSPLLCWGVIPQGCHDLEKWLSQYLSFFPFSFLFFSKDQTSRRVGCKGAHGTLQIEVNSERCISSVQKLNEDSIEFSLSTQTGRVSKSCWEIKLIPWSSWVFRNTMSCLDHNP